ncbi:MAG: DUF2075 domain-containing protein [Akkermansia sp.]|nr:DUF2075 domain-containing protein [Akkermansia sp.]
MIRFYYSSTIQDFLHLDSNAILGHITQNSQYHQRELLPTQIGAWEEEIAIMKEQLGMVDRGGRVIFEYLIPRIKRRVDVVLLYGNIIFLLEFKCGESEYLQKTDDQVCDYALDLRNFQRCSHDKLIVPIQVATNAGISNSIWRLFDRIYDPLKCNRNNIKQVMDKVIVLHPEEKPFDYEEWQSAPYHPTPTIVEAAQELYRNHTVEDITRNDAGATNLSITMDIIQEIIEDSKKEKKKAICFVTGVPGAGKTLVGLDTAIRCSDARTGEHAVYLSGNKPLVEVLQGALAEDMAEHKGIKKTEARRRAEAFIQLIHKYRDEFVGNHDVPPERIAIFDEAQRAWTQEQIASFMKKKKNVDHFRYSEAEFLISTLDRHTDWAVIICLIGNGQEINKGEAGLSEWFQALNRSFSNWTVYISPQIMSTDYERTQLNIQHSDGLHLKTSLRAFRGPSLSAFVQALLDNKKEEAKKLFTNVCKEYPIVITRNLKTAKEWLLQHSRGSTRCGMLASSGGKRLKAEGINVNINLDVQSWFLKGKGDVRSSNALEDVATEFDIQGLEIDYALVAWDLDFYYKGNGWHCRNFSGNKWKRIATELNRDYKKNAYRVLLTRARQGMVIFIPCGSDTDSTRPVALYDEIWNYLRSVGIQEL